MDLNNLELEKCEISPEEEARLESLSKQPCVSCGGPMTVGFEEAFGVCKDCCSEALDHAFSE
jgi:hypothetical protein